MRSMWKIIKNVGYKNLFLFFISVIFGVSSMIFQVKVPMQIKEILDGVIQNKNFELNLIIMLFLYYILSELSESISKVLSVYSQLLSEKELRKRILKNIIENKREDISKNGIGYIQAIIFTDIETFLSIMNPRIVLSVLSIIYIILSSYIMFQINKVYTVILIAYIIVVFMYFRKAWEINSKGFEKLRNEEREIKAYTENLLKARVDLYLFNKIKHFFDVKLNNRFGSYTQKAKKAYSINHKYINMFPEFIRNTAFVLILIISINQLIKREITFGTFQMIMSYSGTILIIASQLSLITGEISKALSTKKILQEYISIPTKNEIEKVTDISQKNEIEKFNESIKSLEIDKAGYGYEDKKIIEGLTFKAKSNEVIILKGKSGSGKTTFFEVLVGNLPLLDGKIRINGKELKESILNKTAYMNQNDYIFKESIYENISLGRDIDKKEVERILQILDLKDFDLDYELEENGKNISGGQKSRILLARTLISKEKEVILLDEPLTGVDKKTKQKILDRLNEFFKNKIAIISTHDDDITKLGKIIDIEKYLAVNSNEK
ncbi:ABC-type multidrug transport system, ATPase and permease component [Marinitoga piezophila KA3]|uniref:ABC-type multidrug transport system, ATPase and permease component n=2 Tax=Petrotogaceae TaxID=1643949 RepID=H2J4Z0_MARPK|nr:ABC-type multidrug transport system, ATPase and permease component [Marinitoga piezophila KA3]